MRAPFGVWTAVAKQMLSAVAERVSGRVGRRLAASTGAVDDSLQGEILIAWTVASQDE